MRPVRDSNRHEGQGGTKREKRLTLASLSLLGKGDLAFVGGFGGSFKRIRSLSRRSMGGESTKRRYEE